MATFFSNSQVSDIFLTKHTDGSFLSSLHKTKNRSLLNYWHYLSKKILIIIASRKKGIRACGGRATFTLSTFFVPGSMLNALHASSHSICTAIPL